MARTSKRNSQRFSCTTANNERRTVHLSKVKANSFFSYSIIIEVIGTCSVCYYEADKVLMITVLLCNQGIGFLKHMVRKHAYGIAKVSM